MQTSPVISRIEALITPSVESMGYRIVLTRLRESKEGRTLQIMAERTDDANMTVDDCADISRTVSTLMDMEDPISGEYRLEISSPGIDRPLVKPEDFIKHSGAEAKLETVMPIEGRKRFKGKIVSADKESVTIESADFHAIIGFDNIQTAKLVLTDELIREHLSRGKKREKELKQSANNKG